MCVCVSVLWWWMDGWIQWYRRCIFTTEQFIFFFFNCFCSPGTWLTACFCPFSRLALYVYEYLLHVGAQKSAQTFLSEVRHNFAACLLLHVRLPSHMRYKSVQELDLEDINCVGVSANVCIICCQIIPADSKVRNHVSHVWIELLKHCAIESTHKIIMYRYINHMLSCKHESFFGVCSLTHKNEEPHLWDAICVKNIPVKQGNTFSPRNYKLAMAREPPDIPSSTSAHAGTCSASASSSFPLHSKKYLLHLNRLSVFLVSDVYFSEPLSHNEQYRISSVWWCLLALQCLIQMPP